MTSQGVGSPLLAMEKTEAEWACQMGGNVRIKFDTTRNGVLEVLGNMQSGDHAVYRYSDFGKGMRSVKLRAHSTAGGTIDFCLDSLGGSLTGQVAITNGREYEVFEAPVNLITDIHELFIIFRGKEGSEVQLDWFRFERN